MDKLIDLLKFIFVEKGCFALFALFFSAVLFGLVPSPLMENKASLEIVKEDLAEHNLAVKEQMDKLIRVMTGFCANNAIRDNDRLGLAICTEDSESTQKFLINQARKAIEK